MVTFKKRVAVICCAVLAATTLAACDSAWDQEKTYQNDLLQRAYEEVGMPEITEFYEKKMAKEILELRDDSDLICYAYTKSEGTGKYVYLGRCMGYGLPYSTQYTSPEVYGDYGGSIPQADPNGLYLPDGLSATWLYLINEETGEPQISYVEPELFVSQGKLPARICEAWSLPADY